MLGMRCTRAQPRAFSPHKRAWERLIGRGQTRPDRLPPGWSGAYMDTSRAAESFRDLLLRHRGRTGLTQLELAGRVGAGRRTVQDWEAGINHPSAELLKALIQTLLEADGLMAGREAAEAHELWAAVLRDAPRMHTPFDELWLASLLRERAARSPAPEATAHHAGTVAPVASSAETGEELGLPHFGGHS